MSICYRPLTVSDLPAARRLWEAVPGLGLDASDEPGPLTRLLEQNPRLSVVATQQGEVVGTALLAHNGRRGLIAHLAVKPEYQRRGIARELVKRGLENLARVGISKCHAHVYRTNENAQSFWEHLGWKPRTDLIQYTGVTPSEFGRTSKGSEQSDFDVSRPGLSAAITELNSAHNLVSQVVQRLDAKQVWHRIAPHQNCVGDIMRQLASQLRYTVIDGLNDEPSCESPSIEEANSALPGMSDLLARLDQAVSQAKSVLTELSDADLERQRFIRTALVTGWDVVFQSISRFRGQTQEIVMLSRSLLGNTYSET